MGNGVPLSFEIEAFELKFRVIIAERVLRIEFTSFGTMLALTSCGFQRNPLYRPSRGRAGRINFLLKGSGIMANMQKGGSSFADQGKEAAGHAMDKAKETAGGVMDKAKDIAGNVAGAAGNAASWAGHRAEDAASGVGSGIKSLGDTIREKGPQGGVFGSATSAVGDTLSNAGSYLEDKGFSGIGGDLSDLIRKNPVPAMLIGVGIGFMLARMTSRS